MGNKLKQCHICTCVFEESPLPYLEEGEGFACCKECAPLEKFIASFFRYSGKKKENDAPSRHFRVEGQSEEIKARLKKIDKLLTAYRYVVLPSLYLMLSFYEAYSREELGEKLLKEKDPLVLRYKERHGLFFRRVLSFLQLAYGDEREELSIKGLQKFFLSADLPSLRFFVSEKGKRGERRIRPFKASERIGRMRLFLRRCEKTSKAASDWEEKLFLQADEPKEGEEASFPSLMRATLAAGYFYSAYALALGEEEAPSFELDPKLFESYIKRIIE